MNDIFRAFGGSGNYELIPSMKKRFLVPIDIWDEYTPIEKRKHFNKFCMALVMPIERKEVTSKDGLNVVDKTNTAKKPGQTTSARNEKTRQKGRRSRSGGTGRQYYNTKTKEVKPIDEGK
jgi:hypothetical protein